ncbi:MAG TPA: imidazolonepropionase [Candidatus Kapabacteria bacterium]|nr:imidazolonepropionase [Candidatus Kapabacteria bacterium]
MKLYHNIRKLYTPIGFAARRGAEMAEIEAIDNAVIFVGDDGRILSAGPLIEGETPAPSYGRGNKVTIERIDCRGFVALPGFVDSHTHCVFAGERSLEFTQRAEGKSYQEIAMMGGGILASVQHVHSASTESIVKHSKPFIQKALALGTTTMEIKSGYGLSTEEERKLLEAAKRLGEETPMEIVKTYLGAHAVQKNVPQADYVLEVLEKQLPALHSMAEFCDVFMDDGYFSKEETIRICTKAKSLGMKIKLHADELAETEGAKTAVELGAFSADHLLKVSDAGIRALAESERTVATLLPITAMSLRAPYAPARKLIDAGCAVAIATDCNPGSAMSENMQFAFTLAVIGMQMSPAEALTAATLNGAAALDRAQTHGSIERNKLADFVLYDIPRLEYLPYHIAVSDVAAVVKRGVIVAGDL